MAAAMAQTGRVRWKCLIGGASKWKAGQVLVKKIGKVGLEARYLEKQGDTFLIELLLEPRGAELCGTAASGGVDPSPTLYPPAAGRLG